MRRRDQQCKPFKTAWKAYLAWRDEQERPAHIAAATAAKPYRLFDDIMTADGKVFQRCDHTRRDIPIEDADPLTLRSVAGFLADRAHVWNRRLAEGSPPRLVVEDGYTIANRRALWEFVRVPGADGASFRWLDSRWDTMFWRDAACIYTRDKGEQLVPLKALRSDRFKPYGQCFGTDGTLVYWFAKELALDPSTMRTQGYFIWDDRKAFMCGTELPVSGSGFRFIEERSLRNKTGPYYRVTDGSRTILIGPGYEILPDDPDF